MKTKITFLLLMVCMVVNAQRIMKVGVSFYAGSTQSYGGEIIPLGDYIGGGFSGTSDSHTGLGEFSPGEINNYDRKNYVSTTIRKWYTMYAISPLLKINRPFFEKLDFNYKVGIAMYGKHKNFLDPNRNEYYHKKDKIVFYPMAGVSVIYFFNKHLGWQAGVDTFSGINTGFIVCF